MLVSQNSKLDVVAIGGGQSALTLRLGKSVSVMVPPETRKPRNARLWSWWAHTDLNRGPKDYELLGDVLCLEKSFVGERRLA